MLDQGQEVARDRFEDATMVPATPVFSPALKEALDALELELRDFLVAQRIGDHSLGDQRPATA